MSFHTPRDFVPVMMDDSLPHQIRLLGYSVYVSCVCMNRGAKEGGYTPFGHPKDIDEAWEMYEQAEHKIEFDVNVYGREAIRRSKGEQGGGTGSGGQCGSGVGHREDGQSLRLQDGVPADGSTAL